MNVIYHLFFLLIFLFSCSTKKVFVGDVYLLEAKYESAIVAYNLTLEASPNNFEVRKRKAIALAKLGDLKKAFEEIQVVLQENEMDLDSNHIAASIAFSLHYYSLVLHYTNVALSVNDDSALAFFLKGRAYHHLNIYDSALKSYNKAIKIKKYYAQAYYYRGVLFSEIDNPKCSIRNFNTASALGFAKPKEVIDLFLQ